MSDRAEKPSTSAPDLEVVGGNTALNFINTLRAEAGLPMETLHTDQDVRAWMAKMDLPEPVILGRVPRGALLESARLLRASALTAVEQKKAGERVSLTALNGYLLRSRSHLVLRQCSDALILNREYGADSAEQMLAPVAEAIADLLITADFSLIRQCEGSGCVLWFTDRTNGRPRRFCTEKTCGTRSRVATHRARVRDGIPRR